MFPKVGWFDSNLFFWVEMEIYMGKSGEVPIGNYIHETNIIGLNPLLKNHPRDYFLVILHELVHWLINMLPSKKFKKRVNKGFDKYFRYL